MNVNSFEVACFAIVWVSCTRRRQQLPHVKRVMFCREPKSLTFAATALLLLALTADSSRNEKAHGSRVWNNAYCRRRNTNRKVLLAQSLLILIIVENLEKATFETNNSISSTWRFVFSSTVTMKLVSLPN